MNGRNLILYLALKYNGDWELMYEAIKNREPLNTKDVVETAEKFEGNYVTLLDKEYPTYFKKYYKPPFILFYKGDFSLLYNQKNLAVVGSRTPSQYGIDATKYLLKDLDEGTVIVSGLAKGIDAIAHRCALDGGLKTIGVLGCGINYVYPSENAKLYKDIEENGLLISEYPDVVAPNASNFPVRNRLIAYISKLVLVTEGKEYSGTSCTVSHALNSGKTVLAVPFEILNNESVITNDLIKSGAGLVRNSNDINAEF